MVTGMLHRLKDCRRPGAIPLLVGLLLSALLLPIRPTFARETFVAVVIVSDLARYRSAHEAFLGFLKEKGVDEKRLRIYVQTPNADTLSLTNAVRKAVGVGADLLVTYGAQATVVARKENTRLPLLFSDVSDPVGLDIVRGVGVPFKGVAGVSSQTPLETLVKTYREIHSSTRLGILYTPDEPGSSLQHLQLEAICRGQSLSCVALQAKKKEDLAALVQSFAAGGGVLFIGDSPLLQKQAGDILAIAERTGIAVISQIPSLAEQGALVTLEADPAEQGELLAEQLVRVLEGGRPEDVPLRRPRNVALVINLRAAKRMQLTVPFQALRMATRVIK